MEEIRIPLTNGKTMIVSPEDHERVVAKGSWFAWKNQSGQWYAVRHEPRINGKSGPIVYAHRFIMGCPFGLGVDHRDGNGLNNRRNNLRIATKSQNGANRGRPVNNTTGFKGITSRGSGFVSQVTHNGKTVYVGDFKTKEEAALAYDTKARELFGDFARTNFDLNGNRIIGVRHDMSL
jgi:hypothetical protein